MMLPLLSKPIAEQLQIWLNLNPINYIVLFSGPGSRHVGYCQEVRGSKFDNYTYATGIYDFEIFVTDPNSGAVDQL